MSILTSRKPIASILCATLIFGCLAGTVWADNTPVTDTLNSGIYSNSGTSYNDWFYDEAKSGAKYAGNSASDYSSIQLRSNENNSGIVTTASGGNVSFVNVTWNSHTSTSGNRQVDIYGKNEAYDSPADLYSTGTAGTFLGSIVCGTGTNLAISGDYSYIGIRSQNGALYLDQIEIGWNITQPVQTYKVVFKANGGSGSMNIPPISECDYTLPQCTFTAPDSSKVFVGWLVSTDNTVHQAGDKIYVDSDVTLTAQWKELSGTVLTDELTSFDIGVSGGYSDWDDVICYSGTYYAGNTTSSSNAIQMKSKDQSSGIVSTESVGYIRRVIIDWNSQTQSGKNLQVYGRTTPYDSSADLYDTARQGNLLGTIVSGTTTELIVDGTYSYIGLRSESGAIYINEITVEWTLDEEDIRTISYDNGGGTGTEPSRIAVVGCTYILPKSLFTAPEGMVFCGWNVNGGTETKMPGDRITIKGDTLLTAVYIDTKPMFPDYVDQFFSYTDETTNVFVNLPEGTTAFRRVNYGNRYYYIKLDADALNSYTFGWADSSGSDDILIDLPAGYALMENGVVHKDSGCEPVLEGYYDFHDGTFTWSDSKTFINCDYFVSFGGNNVIGVKHVGGERIEGYTVTLDGSLGVNYYMDLSSTVSSHGDTAYMEFTVGNNAPQQVYVRDAVKDGDHYIFRCDVAAKEMTTTIKAKLIDGDEVLLEGSFTVKEYADYLLDEDYEHPDYENYRELVIALLNYGAYAQLYFGTNVNKLANAGCAYNNGEMDTDIPSEYGGFTSTLPAGVTFAGVSLSLESETTLSFYFRSASNLSFSYSDPSRIEDPFTVGSYKVVRITGIKAGELGSDITLTVTVNGADYTVSFKPITYCYLVLNGASSDTDLQNVCRALYLFFDKAKTYQP